MPVTASNRLAVYRMEVVPVNQAGGIWVAIFCALGYRDGTTVGAGTGTVRIETLVAVKQR